MGSVAPGTFSRRHPTPNAVAEEAPVRPGMRVVVIGDVAHVSVHPELAELRRGDFPQSLPHVRDVRGGRLGAVVAPDDHGHLADLALGDPADLVLPVPGADPRSPAEVAAVHADEPGILTGIGAAAHGPTVPHTAGSGGSEPRGRLG